MCVWHACSVCVYVCACMCILTCVLGFRDTCVHLCVLHACRGLRLITGIILHCSSILFFEVGPVSQIQSSLGMASLTGQFTMGILCFSSKAEITSRASWPPSILCGFWGSNSVPHICGASTETTDLYLQSLKSFLNTWDYQPPYVLNYYLL